MTKVVGRDVPSSVGLRVRMMAGFKDLGSGTVTSVHADGGYCSVAWDSGSVDKVLFTGQQGDYYLELDEGDFPAGSGAAPALIGSGRTSPMAGDQPRPPSPPLLPQEGGSVGATPVRDQQSEQTQLQKQLLAQEVVKLRREVAELRATGANVPLTSDDDPQISKAKLEIATLEAQKAEVIAQTNAQKALLAKEVKHLRSEIDMTRARAQAAEPPAIESGDHGKEIVAALERRKEFEENFTRTLRDLRKELELSSLKSISAKNQLPIGVRSMIQLSNERIEKVMEEASQVPVEERLHIEALRLLIENSKLRKTLNDYAEGILHNTLSKVE